MTKKTDTKKQPLQSFKAFGIEASVWPPNSEYGETEPKIRIGRGYRDKDGVFRTSTYFSADELVVQIEQCLKALALDLMQWTRPLGETALRSQNGFGVR
jgi:hypothetical protein